MKDIIKKTILSFVILIIIYMSVLTLTSFISKSLVEDNIRKSVKYFYISDVDKLLYISGFTDAIMLDINYRLDNSKPLQTILKAEVISDKKAGIEPLLRI